jgi:hypothetical protein
MKKELIRIGWIIGIIILFIGVSISSGFAVDNGQSMVNKESEVIPSDYVFSIINDGSNPVFLGILIGTISGYTDYDENEWEVDAINVFGFGYWFEDKKFEFDHKENEIFHMYKDIFKGLITQFFICGSYSVL